MQDQASHWLPKERTASNSVRCLPGTPTVPTTTRATTTTSRHGTTKLRPQEARWAAGKTQLTRVAERSPSEHKPVRDPILDTPIHNQRIEAVAQPLTSKPGMSSSGSGQFAGGAASRNGPSGSRRRRRQDHNHNRGTSHHANRAGVASSAASQQAVLLDLTGSPTPESSSAVYATRSSDAPQSQPTCCICFVALRTAICSR